MFIKREGSLVTRNGLRWLKQQLLPAIWQVRVPATQHEQYGLVKYSRARFVPTMKRFGLSPTNLFQPGCSVEYCLQRTAQLSLQGTNHKSTACTVL